jgi:ribosomal 50S subunit-associated protein YjgA (DUF615 family)
MKNNINKKVFNLQDLKQNLLALKNNWRSFFILKDDLTMDIVLGTEYRTVWRKIIRIKNNLTKLLKNYDIESIQETLVFLENSLIETIEKKKKQEMKFIK